MKRRELIFAALGVLLLIAGTRKIASIPILRQDAILGESCRTPVTTLQDPNHKPSTNVLIFHGLSANRRIMFNLGEELAQDRQRAYLLDFPGHGDSTDHFTFARAEQCAVEVISILTKRGEINSDNTILVGHSMGGAIAVRLADRFPAVATIAISPGPMVLPRRIPANLLVFSAQFDLPLLKREAAVIAQAVHGERTAFSDFRQRRAFHLERRAGATHTSLIVDGGVAQRIVEWIDETYRTKPLKRDEIILYPQFMIDSNNAAETALAWSVFGLFGILLIFPLAASLLTPASVSCGTDAPVCAPAVPAKDALLRWVLAALLSVCVLNFVVPLRLLHMYTADYLVSLLLVSAFVTWILSAKVAQASLDFQPRALLMAILLGLATMLAFGAWLNWQLTDAWLNAARWLRFVFLVPLCWPYFFMEELVLGAPPEIPNRGRRALRFGFFLLLRIILWLACLFAYYAFASGQILILITVIYLAAVSILQRLGCDAVRRRTGSATAAATFGAILAAWFFAAVFPLT